MIKAQHTHRALHSLLMSRFYRRSFVGAQIYIAHLSLSSSLFWFGSSRRLCTTGAWLHIRAAVIILLLDCLDINTVHYIVLYFLRSCVAELRRPVNYSQQHLLQRTIHLRNQHPAHVIAPHVIAPRCQPPIRNKSYHLMESSQECSFFNTQLCKQIKIEHFSID